jgi:TorA maturation chaperone TorD
MTLPDTPPTPDTAADRSLARGVVCRALKLGMGRPVGADIESLLAGEGRQALVAAARALEGDPASALTRAAKRLAEMPMSARAELALAYERLFGHTLRGRVCPYEFEYGRPALLLQAQELADLSGTYEAFGLRSRLEQHERADHVGCELDFVEFLSVKEAVALRDGDPEMFEVTHQALRRFLGEHLGRFGRAFASTLQREGGAGFYGLLGHLLEAFLLVECAWLEVPIGPELLELRPVEPDGVPMACGGEDDLVQLGAGGFSMGMPAGKPADGS